MLFTCSHICVCVCVRVRVCGWWVHKETAGQTAGDSCIVRGPHVARVCSHHHHLPPCISHRLSQSGPAPTPPLHHRARVKTSRSHFALRLSPLPLMSYLLFFSANTFKSPLLHRDEHATPRPIHCSNETVIRGEKCVLYWLRLLVIIKGAYGQHVKECLKYFPFIASLMSPVTVLTLDLVVRNAYQLIVSHVLLTSHPWTCCELCLSATFKKIYWHRQSSV